MRYFPDAQKCMSWSTEGSCEFPMKSLAKMQAKLSSSDCQGLWVAPLWIVPSEWHAEQHQTGEIDIFERGCAKADGYLTSFGETDPWIEHDVWGQQGRGDQDDSTQLTAYIEFSPGAYDAPASTPDEIKIYKCPFDANPIVNGDLTRCALTVHRGYYQATKDRTRSGKDLMHLASDVWNVPGQACSGGLPATQCNFAVSDIQMQFTEPIDWKTQCSPLKTK